MGTEIKDKLFQYAVIHHAPGKDDEKGKSHLIVDLTTILAKDEKTAALLAARSIPETHADKLDECEIAIRPF